MNLGEMHHAFDPEGVRINMAKDLVKKGVIPLEDAIKSLVDKGYAKDEDYARALLEN